MEAVTQLENSFIFPNFIFYSLASHMRLSVNGRDVAVQMCRSFLLRCQSLMSLLHKHSPAEGNKQRESDTATHAALQRQKKGVLL